MGKLKVMVAAMLAAAAGAGAGAGPSIAADNPTAGPQCFRSGDWSGWKATKDGQTMYIETGLNRVYKLDMAFPCTDLNDIDAKVITRVRGSSWICYPMDIDMRVYRPGIGSSNHCRVKRLTRLGAAEAKALPRDLRP